MRVPGVRTERLQSERRGQPGEDEPQGCLHRPAGAAAAEGPEREGTAAAARGLVPSPRSAGPGPLPGRFPVSVV